MDGWMKLMKAIINGLMDTMNKIMQEGWFQWMDK